MSPPPVLHCRALLFDLDGVLADSTASVERHWRAWAVRHGVDPAALLPRVHGRRALDLVREVAPDLDPAAEVAALVAAEAGDTAGVVAAPGAPSLLARLPADGWAVVTSGMRAVALASTHGVESLAGADLVVPSLAALRVEAGRSPDGGPAFTVAAATDSPAGPALRAR